MTDTNLPWRIFGRLWRPYVLAVSLSVATITISVATGSAVGVYLDQWPGHVIGAMGAVTVVMLWWGFWARSDQWMARGLLWSAGVWAGVGTILAWEGGAPVSTALAWCWVIASGGAWLLEVADTRGR